MTTMSDFIKTDGVDYPLAAYFNLLFAAALRAEYTNVQTISATKQLTDNDCPIQVLTASGANRDVKLAVEAITNHVSVIRNGGGSNNIVVKDDSGSTTFATLLPGDFVMCIPNGTSWMVPLAIPTLPNDTMKFLRGDGTWGKQLYFGDAAPSSPAADDLWYETDTNMIWTYGTYAGSSRWVSVEKYTVGLGGTAARSSALAHVGLANAQHNGFDLYLDTWFAKVHVITTNNISNYWNYTLRKITGGSVPAAGAGTLLATVNTSSISANAWTDLSTPINAVIDSTGGSLEMVLVDIVLTGAPGNVWDNFGFSYRLVHP